MGGLRVAACGVKCDAVGVVGADAADEGMNVSALCVRFECGKEFAPPTRAHGIGMKPDRVFSGVSVPHASAKGAVGAKALNRACIADQNRCGF